MTQFAYLFLGLSFFAIWLPVFFLRKDLRRRLVISSTVGGFAGILAEIWYFTDYWQPVSIAGKGKFSLEDFLAGFAIAGVAVTIYDFLFQKKNEYTFKPQKKMLAVMFLVGLAAVSWLPNQFGLNTIVVSIAVAAAFGLIILILRRDLLSTWIWSGLIMTVFSVLIYAILFGMLSPDFWSQVLLTKDIPIFPFLGGAPATEPLWFLAWGSFLPVAYKFSLGIHHEE